MSSFCELRVLLYLGNDKLSAEEIEERKVWKQIKKCFNRWDGLDDISGSLLYAKEYMKAWNPEGLVEKKLPSLGKTPPYWPLVKKLSLKLKTKSISQRFLDLSLDNIEVLEFSDTEFLTSLDGFPSLPNMRKLLFQHCPGLEKFGSMLEQPSLMELEFSRAFGLKTLHGLPWMPSLKKLSFQNCQSLCDVSGLANAPNLEALEFSDTTRFHDLESMPELPSLKKLWCFGCYGLSDISGLEKLPNLEELYLPFSCATIDDFSVLKKLKRLKLVLLNESAQIAPELQEELTDVKISYW